MERLILVVDFGTSNVHANAVNCENGDIPFSDSQKYTMLCPQAGYCELNPEEMWEKSQDAVNSIIKEMEKSTVKYHLEAISFSFFGDNIIPVDDKSNALCNMLQCFDVRGKKQAEKLNEEIGAEKLIERTGDVCEFTSCSSKIRYILEEMPKVSRKVKKFYNIQQYILAKLKMPDVNDLTMACTKRMVELETGSWYQPLLKKAGVCEEQLGKIVPSYEVIGTITAYGKVRLPDSVKVVPGAHDCDCGWLGVGICNEEEDVVGNITGTFEHFGFLADGYKNTYHEHPEWEMYSYRGPLKDTSVMLTAFDTSGALLEWFMREIVGDTSKESYDYFWKHAKLDGTNHVSVRPDFSSSGGSISNLNLGVNKTDIFSGIIEALTFESCRMLQTCEHAKRGEINRVRIGGGHTKSSEWVQFRADVTGKTYECMQQSEVSSVGAAILGAIGAGIYKDAREAISKMVKIQRCYTPDLKRHEKYMTIYQDYMKRYRKEGN